MIPMYSFNAAQLLLSISVYATHEVVICVLLDVFDIIRHNKSAAVQLQLTESSVLCFLMHVIKIH